MSKVEKIVESKLSEGQNIRSFLKDVKDGYGYFTADYVDEENLEWEDVLIAIRQGQIRIITVKEALRMNLADIEFLTDSGYNPNSPLLYVV